MGKRVPPTPEEVAQALRERGRRNPEGDIEFVSEDAAIGYLAKKLRTNTQYANDWLGAACDAGLVMILKGEIDGQLTHWLEPISEEEQGEFTHRWVPNGRHYVKVNINGQIIKGIEPHKQPNSERNWVILTEEFEALVTAKQEADEKNYKTIVSKKEAEQNQLKDLFGTAYDKVFKFAESAGINTDCFVSFRISPKGEPLLTIDFRGLDQINSLANLLPETESE